MKLRLEKTISSTLTDDEIMVQLGEGRTAFLEPLYVRYGNTVIDFVRSVLPRASATEAEDLCQEVFLVVYNKAPGYTGTGKFRSWIFGIAARKARSWQRRRWWRERLLRQHTREQPKLDPWTSPSPDKRLEQRYQIAFALSRLSQEQREVMTLRMVQGLSGEEIGEALGISANAVFSRVKRAQRILSQVVVSGKTEPLVRNKKPVYEVEK